MANQKLWFKAKRYGWGWTPVTWQGWTLTGLYALVIIWYSVHVPTLDPISILIPINATVFLLVICYKTGESPRWRWGK